MSFWALASTSLALAAGAFPVPRGFALDSGGFAPQVVVAPRLRFPQALALRLADDRDGVQTYLSRSRPGGPTKLRVGRASPGFDAYFPAGVRLDIVARQAPFLTWPEGTVGVGVPAPATSWVAMSAGISDPPIGLTCLGEPRSLRVAVAPGGWRLESEYVGWIRFFLPFGLLGLGGVDASAYGRLAQTVSAAAPYWTAPALTGREEAVTGESSVEGTTTRDGPGAILDATLVLARFGGYGVRVLSPIKDAAAPLADGPQVFASTPTIRIEYPLRVVAPGRAVVIGSPPDPALVLPDNPHHVVALAQRLCIAAPSPLESQARGWLADFLARPSQVGELSASYSVLAASLGEAPSEEDSELAGVAFWLAGMPESLVRAGRCEARLAAARILPAFRMRRGWAPGPVLTEEYRALRDGIFRGGPLPPLLQAFADSPLRVIGGPVSASLGEPSLRVTWNDPEPRVLVAAPGVLMGAWEIAPGLHLLLKPSNLTWQGSPIPRFDRDRR